MAATDARKAAHSNDEKCRRGEKDNCYCLWLWVIEQAKVFRRYIEPAASVTGIALSRPPLLTLMSASLFWLRVQEMS